MLKMKDVEKRKDAVFKHGTFPDNNIVSCNSNLSFITLKGKYMKMVYGIIAFFMLSSTVQAAENYFVKTKIYDGDQLVGAPAMQVESNVEASAIESGLYELKFTVKPVSAHAAAVSTNLIVGGETLNPSVVVEFGTEGKVTVNGKSFSIVVNRVNS